MFEVSLSDIEPILKDFGISAKACSIAELERYHYEKSDPQSKRVRLIEKVKLADGSSVVIRFKNESDVTQKIIEAQSQFTDLLRENGIHSPLQYKSSGAFAKWYTVNGYDVIVTVEEFVEYELKCVDSETAEETGKLLASLHNISEKYNCHVESAVLFNPFAENELFSFDEFKAMAQNLSDVNRNLHERIVLKYDEYMRILSPLQSETQYAVQGDISCCNLYQTENGNIGIFDFNRCGDNNLFCDAVMQAVFEARLMDYPASYEGKAEKIILPAFLKGYNSERPFSETERKLLPYLYAIIDAFWSVDIVYDENSLLNEYKRGNSGAVAKRLEEIWKRISNPRYQISFNY